MVCASTVPGRARSPAPSKRRRPRRWFLERATLEVRHTRWSPFGGDGALCVSARIRRDWRGAARDNCSGNGQVRGQIETTAATSAIPSGYVKSRRDAARGIATRTAHTAATGVHVLTGNDAREFSASFGAKASLYEDLGKAIGTKNP